MILRRLVAVTATILLAASPVFAQPAPSPSTTSATPALAGTSGLNDSSRSPIGFVPPTAGNVQDYINAIGGIEVNASFHSTADTQLADKKLNMGPFHPDMNVASLKNGADIQLHASYSKKNGQTVATLDDITLQASGVKGPMGLAFQKAEIHADGSMDIKLNNWMPTMHVSKVEKLPNGDINLKGSWWMPTCIVTKAGDVKVGKQVKIFGHEVGLMKTVGHIDPALFAEWPPSEEEFLKLAAAPFVLSGKDGKNPLAPTLEKLAGTMTWDVKANAEGLPITLEGAPIKAKESLEVKGSARMANGEIATIGNDNTAHVQLDIEHQTYGDANNGVTLDSGHATLDGAYRLDIPTSDPKNHMIVDFDGSASYGGTGKDLHVSLPTGAKVSVSQLDVSREGAVHFSMNGLNDKSFKMDDARYAFDAKGPIHIEKLGPISTLDLDGELSSRGLSRISPNGILTLSGDLTGSTEVETSGMLVLLSGQKGWYRSTIKKGSHADVNLDQFAGAVQLPLDGKKFAFAGADVHGTAGVHADLGQVDVRNGGVAVSAPEATADFTMKGSAQVRGTSFTGAGQLAGGVALPQGAAVDVNTGNVQVKTAIDAGSHVGATANVSHYAGATASPGHPGRAPVTIVNGKLSGDLGATDAAVNAFGVSGNVKDHLTAKLDAPFAFRVGPDGKPVIDRARTSARLPIRIDLKKGTTITFSGNTVTITDDFCYIQLTGDIALDATGKPVLSKLENVDVLLELGAATAKLFGSPIAIPGLGATHFKGDVTFSGKTVQVHGDASVTLAGQTAPLFDIKL